MMTHSAETFVTHLASLQSGEFIRTCPNPPETNMSLLSIVQQKPLADIDANSSIAAALETMKLRQVTSLVISGQPGHWLGAGNSNVSVHNKQLIGIISILDIVLFLSSKLNGAAHNYNSLVSSTRVADIIGFNEESLSLWVADTNSPMKIALEPLCKGVHRFLVPIHPPATATNPHPKPVDFHLLTQSDVISQFAPLVADDDRFANLKHAPVSKFMSSYPLSVTREDAVLPVLTALASMNLMAVPVVDKEGILADTLSTSDFRLLLEQGSNLVEQVVDSLVKGMPVGEFLELVGGKEKMRALKGVVSKNTSFGDAVGKIVEGRIHRLWIVDAFGVPEGVLSLGDIIGAIREAL